MPTVPTIPGGLGSSGASPLGTSAQQPSSTDMLMAAADMHAQGRLQKFKQPNPTKPHPQGKKLRVIK